MRLLFEICTCMALALTATSCVRDEVVVVPALPSPSDVIAFGANLPDEATRSAEGGKTLDFSTFDASSEDGSFSLPMAIKVEEGISKYVADTRGAVVDSRDKLTSLKAWARLSGDGTSSLYIPGTAFEKNTTTGIFFPISGESYLWPGEGKTLDFVTVSPANIDGFEPVFDAADDTRVTEFHYTIPADVANQPDILVATTSKSGNFGESVPLDFKHIMAAVNFKVGNVVAGTIQSITMKGVYDHGTYQITTGEWVGREVEGTNFSVPLPSGGLVVTEGSTGQQINNASTQAFMMIPQQPTTGAEIEIVFQDGLTGKTHTLRASIQGHVWGRNTTTNYMINIDGNYNLQIVPLDQLLDSHYIITKVEISSEYPSWTLAVYDTTGDDLNDPLSWMQGEANDAPITIEEESKVNPMAKQGFWTDKVVELINNEYVPTGDSARGGKTITGTTSVSNKVIYVFVPENVSGEDRNITLVLYQTGNISTMKTLTLTQHPVKWLDPGDGNPDNFWGCELLIEGGQIDWGFCWDNLLIEFTTTTGGQDNLPPGRISKIQLAMESAGISVDELYDTNNFICMTQTQKSTWLFQIDLGRAGNIDVAESGTDGHLNTLDIYGFQGISSLNSLVDFIGSWNTMGKKEIDYTATSQGTLDDIKNSLDYAALYAMKRNRFDLQILQNDGTTMYIPTIEPKDINWYLPAKDQFEILMKSDWGQQFSVGSDLYWTSTAYLVDDGDDSKSYAFINGAETVAYRKNKYLTMALRQRTYTADVVVKPEDVVVPGGGDNGPEYGDGGSSDKEDGGNMEGNT